MYKNSKEHKLRKHEWYLRNKQKTRERTNLRRIKAKNHVNNIKKNFKCIKCGYSNFRALVFHHRNRKIKNYTITKMVHSGFSLDKIDKEITNCDILCINCHFIEHYNEYENIRKEKIMNKSEIIRQQRREFTEEIKKNSKCIKCDYSDYRALTFHHRNSKEKIKCISRMVSNRYTIEDITKEIKKCNIVCANCHFIIHYKENNAE